MIKYVDFHCHLDLFKNFDAELNEAEKSGIYTLTVTTTPRAWPRNYELTAKLKYIRPALGFHPQIITKETEHEIDLWNRYIENAKYVGEVGIDASTNYKHTLDRQKKIFEHILVKCSESGNKVLSVHAVKSVGTVLELIEAFMPKERGVVVLHWFTGTKRQAEKALDLGCYFSVNLAMLRSKRTRDVISTIPINRLLTETDAPFIDNVTSREEQLRFTIANLSKLLNSNPNDTSKKVLENFKRLILTTNES